MRKLKPIICISILFSCMRLVFAQDLIPIRNLGFYGFVTKNGDFYISDKEYPLELQNIFLNDSFLSLENFINIDDEVHSLSEIHWKQPFQYSMQKQIDGQFFTGVQQQIKVDMSYFLIDCSRSASKKLLALAVRISNISPTNSYHVGWKSVIEVKNTGQNARNLFFPKNILISRPYIFQQDKIPPYIRIAQTDSENTRQGDFYFHPFLTPRLPNAFVLSSKNSLLNNPWIPSKVCHQLTSEDNNQNNSSGLYFGTYLLNPGHGIIFGMVFSQAEQAFMFPVLEDKVLADSVFSHTENQKAVLQQNSLSVPRNSFGDAMWNYLYDTDLQYDLLQKQYTNLLELSNYTPVQNYPNNMVFPMKKEFE